MKLYEATFTVKTKIGAKVTDQQVEALLASSRFNSLTCAVAIAVNNFNRGSDDFMAEVSEGATK